MSTRSPAPYVMRTGPQSVLYALISILGYLELAWGGLPERTYTLKELLDRASVIVIAETAGAAGTAGRGLLPEGVLKVSRVLKGEDARTQLPFRVEGPPLPTGASAIWFLTAPGPDGVYVIDHPQCAYDVSRTGVVEKALKDPSKIPAGYYLRPEDEQLENLVRRARELKTIAAAAPGRSPEGLELSVRPRPSQAGNFLAVEFELRNTGKEPLLLCDSAEDCYFVRIEREGRTEVVKAVEETPGVRETAIQLVSSRDFTTLRPGGRLVQSFLLARKSVPLLRAPGIVKVAGVYRYIGPGSEELELPTEPWRGMVASMMQEVTLPATYQGKD